MVDKYFHDCNVVYYAKIPLMRRRGIYTLSEFYNHEFECAFVVFLWIWAVSNVLSISFLNLVVGGEDTSSLMVLQPALSLMSFMIIILGLRLRLALVLLCRFNVVQKTRCEGQGWVGRHSVALG